MNAFWQKIWAYLTFKAPAEGEEKANFSLRTMHTINKISLFMFIIGMIILIIKWVS